MYLVNFDQARDLNNINYRIPNIYLVKIGYLIF